MNPCGAGRFSPVFFSAAFLIFVSPASSLWAQRPAEVPHANHGREAPRLKFVVILSRHGVRPPTWTQDRLDAYSAQPWPHWSVPPGYLTPHGYELLKRFSSFDRASLAAAGLIAADGCADAAHTYIWTDTDERTIESGRALAEGLFPGCPPLAHSRVAGERDPLFHPGARDAIPAGAQAEKHEPETQATSKPDAEQDRLLVEMQNVLKGCSPADPCTPARAPAMLLLGVQGAETSDKSGMSSESRQPLSLGASFAEDFLLEYTEGMPSDQIGWGKVDEPQILRFMTLHTEHTELSDRAPVRARMGASNLLFHIERTLEQRVDGGTVEDAIGAVDSKIVLIVGHDTNIAEVAALLGVHWTIDGRKDDTPPGTELAFELWQSEGGAYSVRVTVSMQTLRQMREMQDLTPSAPPAREALTLQGCEATTQTCGWKNFMQIADAAIDKTYTITAGSN